MTIPATYFTVEKCRFYRQGEAYNRGDGFQGTTTDREQAERWFRVFSEPSLGGVHAVELREGERVIKRVGPDMAAARKSVQLAARGWPGLPIAQAG